MKFLRTYDPSLLFIIEVSRSVTVM